MKTTDISIERLHETLNYDPETGQFTWKVTRRGRAQAGAAAGSFTGGKGYLQIKVDGRPIWAHRIAWAMANGAWPEHEVDHINGDRADNRLCNLRIATSAQNKANRRARRSRSGLKGAHLTADGKYTSSVQVNGKVHYIGRYDTAERAHAEYIKAAQQFFGEFARSA